jgi:TP901 family phage tail tape measure protein
MTEQVPGIELFLSSEKAVQGAAKFRDAVESAAQAVERIGLVVDKLDGLLDRVGVAATSAVPPLKRLGDSAAEIGAKLQQGGEQAQRFEARMGRLGGTLGGVARQFALLLGAAGAISGIGAAVSAFADYEDKLRILGSIAGATGAQLQKLEDAAVNLSQNSRFTPREGIDGLTELSRAGLSAQDAITALKPTADLARVGLLGLSDSSAIVTKTLTQFALGADQASRVADVLAKAANSSNADVGTLADALAKTGPVARQFGVSLEDTVAALAKLADNGLAANIAGTGLQRVLIQLRSPTEEAQRALLGLGLTAEKINPEKVGLTGALRNLSSAGLSVQDSVSLVGTEFASLLTILTGSVGAIDQVGAALRDSTGQAAKQAAAGADTLAAAFADLRGASEQFAASAGRGGIGQALTDITRTGAEVIRVLAGDKKAMEEAGAAAKLLATGLQLATVAGVAFAAAKVAGVIAGVASSLKQATAATVVYEAATGLAVARVGVAARAFAALTAVMSANPFVAVATAIAGVVSALTVFGGGSDKAEQAITSQGEKVRELKQQYEDLARAIAAATRTPGQFDDRGAQAEGVRRTRDELQELGKRIEALKGQRVPLDQVLGLAELTGAESRLGKIRALIDSIPEVLERARTRSDRFGTFNVIKEFEDQLKALGVTSEKEIESFYDLQSLTQVLRQRFVEYADGIQFTQQAAASLDNTAKDLGVSLAKVGEGNKTDISSAVRALVAERERELELAKLTGVEREKAILVAEAEKRAGQGLNDAEKERLATLAQALVDGEALVQQRRREKQEAEKAAELQRELPKNLAELQKRYQEDLSIAQATGLQRELIRAAVEAENDAKAIGLALDTESFAQLKAQAEERARLAFEEKQQKRETRVDKRQDEALRQLEQEEQLLRLSGAEREKYRLQIEAENEARQAGLVIGTDEYADFMKRKVAVGELARAQEQLGQLASQFAGSWTSALEQFIIDGGKARDVARALAQDLARLALRQTAGAGLASLFQQGAQGLAGLFAGSGPTQNGLPVAPGSSLPDLNSQIGFDPLAPRLTGGLIPAMVGAVIDQPTILRRGDNSYSVAEGAKTTPEAIFRLARDDRGNLGVAAVGGGGDTFNMSFPGVRNAQDAKAMRSTFGQQVRAIRAGDKRGRRGRRPAGE